MNPNNRLWNYARWKSVESWLQTLLTRDYSTVSGPSSTFFRALHLSAGGEVYRYVKVVHHLQLQVPYLFG